MPGRNWFITGASKGLGKTLTELVLSEGDDVIATVRQRDALNDLSEIYGERLTVMELDVTSPKDVSRIIAESLARCRIDIVVNNAGYALVGATEEMTDEEVQHQIATNLLAPIQITRAFIGPMREQRGGRIVQISSVGGQVAYPVSSVYHATKWGLEGFTEGVSQEVKEFGIHFTIIEPGAMRTEFVSSLRLTAETPTYQDTIVGNVRRRIVGGGSKAFYGDPMKFARAIFDISKLPKPPIRVTLGADAYESIQSALKNRLDALQLQRELACSMAFTE